MPIVLEGLDGELMEKLTRLANTRKVSVEDQIVTVLKDALGRRRDSLADRADEIAAMTPKGVSQTDSVVLIREDRDR